MKQQAKDLIDEMCRLFNARALDELVALFDTPLPIYSAEGLRLSASHGDTERSLRELVSQTLSAGGTSVTYNLVSVETTRSGRQEKATVIWSYLDDADQVVATSHLIYYCGKHRDGSLRIQMVEYLQPAFSEVYDSVPPDTSGYRHH